jgi:WD40 repeat protein
VEVSSGGKKGATEKEERDVNKIFTTMEFTPDGTELLVGQRDGKIQVIEPTSGKYKKLAQPLKVSEEKSPAIKHLVVSEDGLYFATSDANKGVCLFKKDHVIGQPDKEPEWIFTGKILSHEIEITGLCFGQSIDENDQVLHRLFSIGADRRCFEYNIKEAKLHASLPVLKCFDIELEAKPTACIWYPQLEFKEGLILTANDEYKMKLWNPTLPNSRRTCLGPTYGGEIVKLKLLNVAEREKFLIYSTSKKVIGLIKLPLDGNPNKTMGLIAHPDEVTDICATSDGKYIFTCGGDDLAVNMWHVDTAPIE